MPEVSENLRLYELFLDRNDFNGTIPGGISSNKLLAIISLSNNR